MHVFRTERSMRREIRRSEEFVSKSRWTPTVRTGIPDMLSFIDITCPLLPRSAHRVSFPEDGRSTTRDT